MLPAALFCAVPILVLLQMPSGLASNPAPWKPPAQSAAQAATFQRAAAKARDASVAATPELLAALALPTVKAAIHGP
jgi:hypothetical protein